MNQPSRSLLTKAGTAGLICLALTGAVSLAQAGTQGHPSIGQNEHHIDRDYHKDHAYRYFGFPSWWYASSTSDQGPGYDSLYWHDLAVKVQSALARFGFYHGRINGVINSQSRHTILTFQKTNGLAETGLVDPALLKALQLAV
jgi:Putative peptidoglycan binding domain